MIIRPAQNSDIAQILAIYNHEVRHSACTAEFEPRSLDAQVRWYRQHVEEGFPVLVAEAPGGHIAGWASLSPYHSRIAYRHTAEDSVYIKEAHRGQGLGKRLLAELIVCAREMRLHAIIAAIERGNQASIRLHAGMGFVEAGCLREVMRKFDRWLDVVYMELILQPVPAPAAK